MCFRRKSDHEKIYKAVVGHMQLREGNIAKSYADSLGFLTGGVGHLLTEEEAEKYPLGTEIPEAVREEWLELDLGHAIRKAIKQVGELALSGNRKTIMVNALVSVIFQLGAGWLHNFPGAWKALKAHDWDLAIDQLLWVNPKTKEKRSLWYRQTPVRVKDFIKAIECMK